MIHYIHGFNEYHNFDDGPKIGVLYNHLDKKGRKQHVHDYGAVGLLAVSACNDNFARLIAGHIKPNDTLICYSNGCEIARYITEVLEVRCKTFIFISPAVKSNWQPPSFVKHMVVLFNEHDKAVKIGAWYSRIARLMPWNWNKNWVQWGQMGKTGYTGPQDNRIINYNTHHTAGLYPASGHGGVLEDAALNDWGGKIESFV